MSLLGSEGGLRLGGLGTQQVAVMFEGMGGSSKIGRIDLPGFSFLLKAVENLAQTGQSVKATVHSVIQV